MNESLDNFGLLKTTIQGIKKLLEEPSFRDPNEQSVKQGIIMPILQALSWPILNPNVVYPEYPVEGGRVDYALCDNGHPLILIEAKRFNRLDGAEWQVFQYSFHVGTQMVILTDGLEWKFFLPGEEGAYYERILCDLKLEKDSEDDIITCFDKYLGYENVMSRKAISSAREDYQQNRKSSVAQNDSDRGVSLKESGSSRTEGREFQAATKTPTKVKSGKSKSISPCRFIFQGKEIVAKNHQEAAAILLNMVADMDSSLLDQIASMPGHGENRKYLANSQTGIYPNDPARSIQKTFQFRPGWWIPGGLGTRTFKKIVDLVCKTGRFNFGEDIML